VNLVKGGSIALKFSIDEAFLILKIYWAIIVGFKT